MASISRGPAVPCTARVQSRSRSGKLFNRPAQLNPQQSAVHEGFHGVQAGVQARQIEERLVEPPRQKPGAHSRARVVQHPQERVAPPLVPLRDLQVAPRVRVERHVLLGRVGDEPGQLGQGAPVGLAYIRDQCSRGADGQRQPGAPISLQRSRREMLQQPPSSRVECPVLRVGRSAGECGMVGMRNAECGMRIP